MLDYIKKCIASFIPVAIWIRECETLKSGNLQSDCGQNASCSTLSKLKDMINEPNRMNLPVKIRDFRLKTDSLPENKGSRIYLALLYENPEQLPPIFNRKVGLELIPISN